MKRDQRKSKEMCISQKRHIQAAYVLDLMSMLQCEHVVPHHLLLQCVAVNVSGVFMVPEILVC